MNNSSICADSSLLIKLTIGENDSEKAEAKWLEWNEKRIDVVAPRLILYEFVSALWQGVRRKAIEFQLAEEVLVRLLDLPLIISDSPLHASALRLSNDFGLPSSYDAHYLALAQELDCEFWTADERLYNAVRDSFPLIRWLGAAEALTEDQPDEDR
jgi:predicted nucleic acid-binding protein